MLIEAKRSRRQLISLTPLIDVVFILLVFFMLASSFSEWRSIGLNAPAIETSSAASGEGAILVRIGADGTVDLNGQPLTLVALESRVQDSLAAQPQRSVLVMPAPSVELQTIAEVLDRLAAAGAKNLSLTGKR